MKLKIKNPKLLSFLLTNAIILSQSGCTNIYNKNDKDFSNIQAIKKNIENEDLVSKKLIISEKSPVINEEPENKIEKCNHNVSSKKKLTIKEDFNRKSSVIAKVGQYQKLKQIGKTTNGWSLVKYKGSKGCVKSKNLSELGKTYIEIDISDQRMTYYKNNEKFLSTNVVTGKDSTPTVKGLFKIYSKNTNYTMRGPGYTSFSNYVLKFYNSYYIHDASWRNSFGGNIYHYNGSHGCVNTPYKKVKKMFNNTSIGTKVLIHK